MSGSNLVGQTIGNYRIEALLGTGGMGQVYRANHALLNRPAAIKVMHANLASDATFQARFIQEAKSVAALNHPNIVQIYDFGEQGGRYYLVMELVTGGSVRGLLQRRASSPRARTLNDDVDLIRQAADALAYAHLSGMVHRDIKPDNLLLQSDSTSPGNRNYVVKVTDFGLARLASGGVLTATGVTMGTPAYMSPEQCQGIDLDGRSDIYSLGVVLYEMVTGLPPFEVKSLSEAVHKHVYVAPPPPRQTKADVPANLEQIILRCLAKKPDERYRSASDLASALRGITGNAAPINVPPPVGQVKAPPVPAAATPNVLGTAFSPVSPGGPSPAMATMLGAASQPLIRVTDNRGEVLKEIPLTSAGLTLGRLADNDIVLEGNDISRHHLKLEWDGSRVTVTDLGSSNGTLLADSRLLPQVPQTWSARDWVRVGTFWLRYQAPTMPDTKPVPGAMPQAGFVAAAGPAGQAAPAVPQVESTRLRVTLDQERLALTPGQPTIVRAMLTNMGSTVDHLGVTVEGVPPEWVKGPGQETQLNPGAQAPVALNVNVPRVPSSTAQDYSVTVRVHSREKPGETSSAYAQWTVLPFTGGNMTMEPSRRGGRTGARFAVTLRNDGNSEENYTLSGKDDEQVLRYRFEQETVPLAPGASAKVRLNVRSERRWVGTSQGRQFGIQATPASGSPPYNTNGDYIHRALIPPWLPPAALAVAAALAFLIWKLLNPAPVLPKIDSITLDPTSPIAGQPFVVHWTVRNAKTVEIRPVVSGLDPTTGQFVVNGGLPNNASLTLVATNDSGSTEQPIPISVVVPTPTPTPQPEGPSIDVWSVTPDLGQPGQVVTIKWQVSKAEKVEIDAIGTVPNQGEQTMTLQETTTFRLTATNKGITETRVSKVTIVAPTPVPTPPSQTGNGGSGGTGGSGSGGQTQTPQMTPTMVSDPVITLSADKSIINPYECTTLHWTIQNAKSATLDGDKIDLNGSRENVCPTKTTTYTFNVVSLMDKMIEQKLLIQVNPWIPDYFVEDWRNTDPNTGGLTRLIISKVDDNTLSFHGFGKCHPDDCDWDVINVPFTGAKLVGTYDFGFEKVVLTVTRKGDELTVDALTDYPSTSSQSDRTDTYTLKPYRLIVRDPNLQMLVTPEPTP